MLHVTGWVIDCWLIFFFNHPTVSTPKTAYGLDLFEIIVLIPKIPWLNDQVYVSPNIDKGQICWELFLPSNEQATKMDTVNGRNPAPVDGWSFFPWFRRVFIHPNGGCLGFLNHHHISSVDAARTMDTFLPQVLQGWELQWFFFAQHGNSPFFWYQKFCEKLICDVFFCFTFAKRQPFFWTETAVFYFLALETAPQKKASYWWTRSCESGTLPAPLKNPAIFLVFFWGNFLPLVWIPFWRSVARLKIPVSRHGSCHLQFSSRQICEWFWTRFGAADARFGLHKKPTVLCSNFHVLSILVTCLAQNQVLCWAF